MDLGALEEFLETTGPLAVVDLETTGLSQDPESELLEFQVADESAWDVGLACGGSVRIYLERVEQTE